MSPQDKIEAEPLRIKISETAAHPAKGWHPCVIGDHITFVTDGLESFCFAESRPVIYDLILLAAGVELCDKSRRRPRHGWRRRFALDIPVHDLALWSSQAVVSSARDVLEFLTGDEWDLQFRARRAPVPAPRTPTLPLPIRVGAVMPYSDGLDSRAVATIVEKETDGHLVRVRLGPLNDPAGSGPRHFAKVPYTVKPLDKAVETSGRSRAFKFTALAGIAAMLSGTNRIIMAESFQGGIGPVLVPVAHAYEDYRNHPLFTDRMAAFLGLLLGHGVKFEYPRLWSTKGETISEALRSGLRGEKLLAGTRSCWQQSRQVSFAGKRRQCGICAACVLRRMSLHAAGLEDAAGTFVWQDLSAPSFAAAALEGFNPKKITHAQREYAIAGALHMEHLAEFPNRPGNAEELAHAAYRLSRPLSMPEDEAATRIRDVLNRHRSEWRAFLASVGTESFLHPWTKGDLP